MFLMVDLDFQGIYIYIYYIYTQNIRESLQKICFVGQSSDLSSHESDSGSGPFVSPPA